MEIALPGYWLIFLFQCVASMSLNHPSAPTSQSVTRIKPQQESPLLGFQGVPKDRQEVIRSALQLEVEKPEQIIPGGVTLFAARNSRWLMLVDQSGQMVAAKSPDYSETNQTLRGTARATSFVAPRVINSTHAFIINRGGGMTSIGFYDFQHNVYTPFYVHPREFGQVHHDVRYNPLTNEALVLVMYNRRDQELPGTDVRRDFTDNAVLKVGVNGVIWRWDLRDFIFKQWWKGIQRDGHPCNGLDKEDWSQRRREMRRRRTTNMEGGRGGSGSGRMSTTVCRDWTHTNSIYWDIEEGAAYLMCKHMNTFYKLNIKRADEVAYNDKDDRQSKSIKENIIEWGVGSFADFRQIQLDGSKTYALFKFAHEPIKVAKTKPDGSTPFIIFNNNVDLYTGKIGDCEMVEFNVSPATKEARVTFTYALEEGSSRNMGSIQKLPNGNYLGQFPYQRVTVEVNKEGKPVWFLRKKRLSAASAALGNREDVPRDELSGDDKREARRRELREQLAKRRRIRRHDVGADELKDDEEVVRRRPKDTDGTDGMQQPEKERTTVAQKIHTQDAQNVDADIPRGGITGRPISRRRDGFSRASSVLHSWLSYRAQRLYLTPVIMNVWFKQDTHSLQLDVTDMFHTTYYTKGTIEVYKVASGNADCQTIECFKEGAKVESATKSIQFPLYHTLETHVIDLQDVNPPLFICVRNQWDVEGGVYLRME